MAEPLEPVSYHYKMAVGGELMRKFAADQGIKYQTRGERISIEFETHEALEVFQHQFWWFQQDVKQLHTAVATRKR